MKLALGTVQFGLRYGIANQTGQVTHTEAKAMLQLALANGVDTLDTAISYGDSETTLGKVGTQGFKLVTKLPALPNDCDDVGAWVQRQVTASLTRLGVNAAYGLLLHRPDQLLKSNGAALYRALREVRDTGQVKKVGVSIYSPDELTALFQLRYRFDLVQAPFNLVDRRLSNTGWLRRLKDNGVEVHTRSAFLQGLLLMSETDRPQKFSRWDYLWHSWHRWLADCDSSAVQASLAFPLSFPEIDRVIVGADGVSQLSGIVGSLARHCMYELPNLSCEDENLINPANWNQL